MENDAQNRALLLTALDENCKIKAYAHHDHGTFICCHTPHSVQIGKMKWWENGKVEEREVLGFQLSRWYKATFCFPSLPYMFYCHFDYY